LGKPIEYNLIQLSDEQVCSFVIRVDLSWDGRVKDLIFVKTDKRFAELTGQKEEDMIGKSYFDVIEHPNPEWKRIAYQVAYRGEEFHGRLKSEEFGKWLDFDATQVREGFVSIVLRDITDIHKQHIADKKSKNTANVIIACARVLEQEDMLQYALDEVLNILKEVINAERMYVIEVEEDQIGIFIVRGDSKSSTMRTVSSFSKDKVRDWRNHHEKYGKLVIENRENIRESRPLQYEFMENKDMESLYAVPLYDGEQIIGYLGIDNYNASPEIDLDELMETVALFIAAKLRNQRLLEQLRYLSHVDLLTGVNNRNYMNEVIARYGDTPVLAGVLYLDVNGLKVANDTYGHEAGDRLIQGAAHLLQEVFAEYEVYRAGGDEFVVLSDRMSETEFLEAARTARQLSGKDGRPEVAVGFYWPECPKPISAIMAVADERMYQDKAEYNKTHDRRRQNES